MKGRWTVGGWATAADVATVLTGLSALTAAAVWLQSQWREWRIRRAETSLRSWHGYIEPAGISTWRVQLVEAEIPQVPSARVVLEVVDEHGSPAKDNQAYNLRQCIDRDGMLARVPTPAEQTF